MTQGKWFERTLIWNYKWKIVVIKYDRKHELNDEFTLTSIYGPNDHDVTSSFFPSFHDYKTNIIESLIRNTPRYQNKFLNSWFGNFFITLEINLKIK